MRDKTQALIAGLALSGIGTLTRNQAADLLWEGGRDPKASLRQSIREIKTVLDAARMDVFSADSKFLKLDLDQVWVDARAASRCARSFSLEEAEKLVERQPGWMLDGLDVTEEPYVEWVRVEKSRREGDLLASLEAYLGVALRQQALKDQVKRIADFILALDPINETAHRGLILKYLGEDDKASALRQYETCRTRLEQELGVEPSPETQALAAEARTPYTEGTKSAPAGIIRAGAGGLLKLKPKVEVYPFTAISKDEIHGFAARAFAAAICENLTKNRQLMVQNETTSDLRFPMLDLGKPSLDRYTHYAVRGALNTGGGHAELLVQLYDTVSGEICWMKRADLKGGNLLAGHSDISMSAALEMMRFIELKE
ncbi:AfsR/SARP family transcriptional regulator [Sneathiella chinensis]|nr:BTAD domain-containing putative transcriptional regulator [Sneathiella chinensis]